MSETKMEWKGSANIWSLGNAKAAAELPKIGDKIVLGSYVGMMTKLSKRASPKTGEIDLGMYGSFFGVPDDKTKPVFGTHVLYLPDPVMQPLFARFSGDDRVANLIIGYDLESVRSDNSKAKFVFNLNPKFAAYQDDPMERVFKLIGRPLTAADQEAARDQTDKSEAKGKGGKK